MTQADFIFTQLNHSPEIQWKLWIYTNFDCNLRCSYCVAESSPSVPRRAIDLDTVRRLVDEAIPLGFESLYFTGGEPFILPEIYTMLSYAAERVKTYVLTNAMLFQGSRLQKLLAIQQDNLILQVSLDGARPEHHDPYRGAGTWAKTVEGIRALQEHGFRVRLSTTLTPANESYQDEICAFHQSLGIPEEDHFTRPLAKRGLSNEGLEVGIHNLNPEITVSREGIYWHPLTTQEGQLIREQIFPLSEAVRCIQEKLATTTQATEEKMNFK